MKARLMQFLLSTLVLVALILASGVLYIRFVPHEASEFHRSFPGNGLGDHPMPGGFEAVRPVVGDVPYILSRIDAVIQATPRTRYLSGSIAEGHISYVTRSAVMGFPDTTNVWVDDQNRVHIHGHLRFGGSDLGVNQKRIKGWLVALGEKP